MRSHHSLLAGNYDSLDTSERARSVELAKQRGQECAREQFPGIKAATENTYFQYIVEPAIQDTSGDEYDEISKQINLDTWSSDPRVSAFLKSFAEEAERMQKKA